MNPLPPDISHAAHASAGQRSLEEARKSASSSAAQGAPWLIAFGTTLALTAALSFVVPLNTAVLVVLFQGGLAVPLAFALERWLGTGPMPSGHPLRSLSIQLAMVQILALPAVILMYTVNPALVPATFAAIGGAHFLPYVWLHQTRIYLFLGLAVSLGSWGLTIGFGEDAYRFVLLWWPLCYAVGAALLLRRYRDMERRSLNADGPALTASTPSAPGRSAS